MAPPCIGSLIVFSCARNHIALCSFRAAAILQILQKVQGLFLCIFNRYSTLFKWIGCCARTSCRETTAGWTQLYSVFAVWRRPPLPPAMTSWAKDKTASTVDRFFIWHINHLDLEWTSTSTFFRVSIIRVLVLAFTCLIMDKDKMTKNT